MVARLPRGALTGVNPGVPGNRCDGAVGNAIDRAVQR
jgi:hypothetical protein